MNQGDYPPEDLAVLKSYEDMLTVCGGEHCGGLYVLLVGCDLPGIRPMKTASLP